MRQIEAKANRNRRRLVIEVDMAAWRAASPKLSLRETGELVRALKRAQSSRRPNRDQRMLLAIFTRDPDAEVAS